MYCASKRLRAAKTTLFTPPANHNPAHPRHRLRSTQTQRLAQSPPPARRPQPFAVSLFLAAASPVPPQKHAHSRRSLAPDHRLTPHLACVSPLAAVAACPLPLGHPRAIPGPPQQRLQPPVASGCAGPPPLLSRCVCPARSSGCDCTLVAIRAAAGYCCDHPAASTAGLRQLKAPPRLAIYRLHVRPTALLFFLVAGAGC